MEYSKTSDSKLEELIHSDLLRCTEEFKLVFGSQLLAIWLIGGFARGECGVELSNNGQYRPANNYDFLLVFKNKDSLPSRQNEIEAIKARLNKLLAVPLEVSSQCVSKIISTPNLIIYKDILEVGRSFYGPSPKELMNRVNIKINFCESLNIIRNRGMLFLASKKRIDHLCYHATNKQVRIWLSKVCLGYTDAILIQKNCYVTSYVEKAKIIDSIHLSEFGLSPQEEFFFKDMLKKSLDFRLYGASIPLENYIDQLNNVLSKIHLICLQNNLKHLESLTFVELFNLFLKKCLNIARSLVCWGPLKACRFLFLTKLEVLSLLSYPIFYGKKMNSYQRHVAKELQEANSTIEQTLIHFYVSELV